MQGLLLVERMFGSPKIPQKLTAFGEKYIKNLREVQNLPEVITVDEPWKGIRHASGRHMPMQSEPGDIAIFLRKASVEINYDGETYLVVPRAGILVLLREDLPPIEKKDIA